MDTAKLYEELVDIKKRLKRIEDMTGVTHFCELRDEEIERTILGHLSSAAEASERTISQETGVDLADLTCYTASLLYRDLILVTSVESEVHDGFAVNPIRKLGITNKGREYLAEISG